MTHKIIHISLLSLALSLSACVEDTGEPADDTLTSEEDAALSGGPWTWTNTATLRCLDSNFVGSAYTQPCNGNNFQLWTNTPFSFGDQIRDKQTGLCLDSAPSGHTYTLACNGGSYQQWTVRSTGSFGFEIRNVATGFCLDSNTEGIVYTLPCNNGNFQRWL